MKYAMLAIVESDDIPDFGANAMHITVQIKDGESVKDAIAQVSGDIAQRELVRNWTTRYGMHVAGHA